METLSPKSMFCTPLDPSQVKRYTFAMEREKKTKQIVWRATPERKEMLEALAASDRRSLASCMDELILAAFTAKGLKLKKRNPPK